MHEPLNCSYAMQRGPAQIAGSTQARVTGCRAAGLYTELRLGPCRLLDMGHASSGACTAVCIQLASERSGGLMRSFAVSGGLIRSCTVSHGLTRSLYPGDRLRADRQAAKLAAVITSYNHQPATGNPDPAYRRGCMRAGSNSATARSHRILHTGRLFLQGNQNKIHHRRAGAAPNLQAFHRLRPPSRPVTAMVHMHALSRCHMWLALAARTYVLAWGWGADRRHAYGQA